MRIAFHSVNDPLLHGNGLFRELVITKANRAISEDWFMMVIQMDSHDAFANAPFLRRFQRLA
jgi:hypothetical protein